MTFALLHIPLHVLLPGALARWLFPNRWKQAWLIMVLTMLVELDHLLADPIFDPNRCSIGFHPLHRWPAIIGYGVLLVLPMTRIVGAGLLVHMGLDGMDCVLP